MTNTIVARDESKASDPDQQLTEERFLEQFAALEEDLSLLHNHMRRMSENVRHFGNLVRQIRRSTCPSDPRDKP